MMKEFLIALSICIVIVLGYNPLIEWAQSCGEAKFVEEQMSLVDSIVHEERDREAKFVESLVETVANQERDSFFFGQLIHVKYTKPGNDNWELLSNASQSLVDLVSGDRRFLAPSKDAWAPRLQPGEQAIKLTKEGINLYLDNEKDYQPGELYWLAIYGYGFNNPNSLAYGNNKDIKLHIFARPEDEQVLKVMVYRLTEEEMKN